MSMTCENCVRQGCCSCWREDFDGSPEPFIYSLEAEHTMLVAPFNADILINPPIDRTQNPRTRGIYALPRKLPPAGGWRLSMRC